MPDMFHAFCSDIDVCYEFGMSDLPTASMPVWASEAACREGHPVIGRGDERPRKVLLIAYDGELSDDQLEAISAITGCTLFKEDSDA